MADLPTFVARQVFSDPTPNGLINQRYLQHFMGFMDATLLDERERDQVFRMVILVGKKLAAVWKHKEAYQTAEQDSINACKPHDGAKVLEIHSSEDLLLEFDEFLVQLKSTLDYLVKLPAPILGRKTWTLRTFGSKGEDVIKAMRRNLGKTRKPQVDGIIKMLFAPSREWLQNTIEARDKINHYIDGGIPFEYFSVYYDPETGDLRRPMWSTDQTIAQFMEVCWINLFRFVEDFTALFLFFRHKAGLTLFHGPAELSSLKSPWLIVPEAIFNDMTATPGWTFIEE